MSAICKIMSPKEWESTVGSGKPYLPILEADLRDGFIHCSTSDQLLTTLSRFYEGVDEVVIAVIDEEKLTSELRWEPGARSPDQLFPHIYGHIEPEAIVGAYHMKRKTNGAYELPQELEGR